MNVIYQNTEDDPEDTVVPRFINAGGDLNRIFLYHKSVSNRYQIDTWKLALIFLR